MKDNMNAFLNSLIDTKNGLDIFDYQEHNYELNQLELACGPDRPEEYYYFWDSSNPITIIAAMRKYIARKRHFDKFYE